MERKVKVVQYGTGKMSVYSMRYVYEKGAEIVGAFDINPDVIGKDIGKLMECEDKGVIVKDANEFENFIQSEKPDICIVTTMSLLSDVNEELLICARNGINAITTCEEAFDSWNSNPTLTKKIDKLARDNNCTITGSGYQDIYWGALVSAIASSSHTINKIIGSSSYNVEEYGIALAKAHGAGLSLKEFDRDIASHDNITTEARNKLIENGEFLPSYMWNVNGWLASKLGLTITSQTQKCVPQTYNEDLQSSTLEMIVKKGNATGMSAVVTTETKEGIVIESECIGKIYSDHDIDKNEWTIEGEPNTTFTINMPATVELTCATVVNRIPDVLNAEAGFITSEKLPTLNYRVKPLNEYVNIKE